MDLRSDELADYLESLPKDEQERIKKSLDNKDKDDKTDKDVNNEKDIQTLLDYIQVQPEGIYQCMI